MKRTVDDAAWSLMIRARAGFRCERCGAWHEEKSRGLHAAHIFTRSIKKTRCDPANGVALCYGCHSWGHRNPLEFHEWVRKHIGARKYDALKLRAKRL
jgi:hypothetical protein